MRNPLLVLLAGVLTVALVAGGALWWRAAQTTDLQRALALTPAGAERLTWTDWSGVRDSLDADVSSSSTAEELTGFLSTAYDADLSPMSALLESAETMQEEYGFSPASLEWELLSQSREGMVLIMKLPEDADLESLGGRLEGLGYERPEEDAGVWRGGIDLLPSIGGTLTPTLQYLGLDEDAGLVVASDTERYLEQAMLTVSGEEDSVEDLDEVVGASGQPLAAAIYGGDVACSSLAMGNAGPADQDQARELVAAAGEVNPLTGFAMSVRRDRDVRVSMSFETSDQAVANADSRAALAVGPAPGQGGDFGDRFRLGRVAAEDEVVTMELDPVEGSYVLSDLSSGPLLFATC